MKILFLARYLPAKGSTMHIYSIAKGLIDRGHDVYIISAGPKEEEAAKRIFNDVIEHGVKHYKVRFPLDPDFSILGKLHQLCLYIMVIPRVIYLMFKIKPDVIHVHYPVTSYLAKIYANLTGKKFIMTYHISGIPKHVLHRKADYVIAISREMYDELLKRFNYNQEQIRLIFNGVSTDKFYKRLSEESKCSLKEELNLPVDKPIIGFVGSLCERKGVDILLEACSKLTDIDFHVVLVGNGDVQWVEELINNFNLKGRVSIYPFQDPVKFYSVFDIFVLPSRKEGFPLVAVEAMMMGIPTIRSDVGGARDQIEHEINGYIFENKNSTELYRYIKLLLKDKELRERIGQKAQLHAINNFSEDIMIEKLLQVYKEIIESERINKQKIVR